VACDAGVVPGSITIHFVCTGNIYRSRLAEAYCASKRIPGLRVFSSGIAAGRDGNALISPYAAEALAGCNLSGYAAERWQRTTVSLVQESDVVVFMEAEHQRFCDHWIEPGRQRLEVWGIEDIGPMDAGKIPAKVARTFQLIRERCDALLHDLGLVEPEARGK
jgi:protein-tyrosine-phosphatase